MVSCHKMLWLFAGDGSGWHSLRPGPGESRAQSSGSGGRSGESETLLGCLCWAVSLRPGHFPWWSYFYFFISTTDTEPGNVLCLQASHWHTHSYVTCEQSFSSQNISPIKSHNCVLLHISVVKRHNMEICCGCVVLRGFWGAFYSRFAHSEWEKTTSCIHKFCRYDWNLNKYILIREINLIKQVM